MRQRENDPSVFPFKQEVAIPRDFGKPTPCHRTTGLFGINDEYAGLIRFVRGEDYFDYDHDCDLAEPRMRIDKKNGTQIISMMADIYNSTLLIIGDPKAAVESTSTLSEAYYRASNNYSGWASGMINRKEVISCPKVPVPPVIKIFWFFELIS